MKAKELKIKNLIRQREFINSELLALMKYPRPNGDVSVVYDGDLFEENETYFREEGFEVRRCCIYGKPLTILTVAKGKERILDEKEKEIATSVDWKKEDIKVLRRAEQACNAALKDFKNYYEKKESNELLNLLIESMLDMDEDLDK